MAAEKHKTALERLRGLSDEDLQEELRKTRERLFTMRRQHVTRQLENFAGLSLAKKQIARIITLQAERAAAGGK